MSRPRQLDEFGKHLMEYARDKSIWSTLNILHHKNQAKRRARDFPEFAGMSDAQLAAVERFGMDTVDDTIHNLLFFLQDFAGVYELSALDDAGGRIDLCAASDGIHGESFGEDGWIARFSEFPHRRF